jgi:DNA replication protein DnaC
LFSPGGQDHPAKHVANWQRFEHITAMGLDLWRKLESLEELPVVSGHRCALDYQRPCCRGKGYLLSCKGPYIDANVCACVKQCAACSGKMYRLDEKNCSSLCRVPSPLAVVGAIKDANFPRRYLNANFGDFVGRSTGNGKQVAQEVQRWIQGFSPISRKGLVVSGPVGVGKTHLMVALGKEVAARGFSVKFIDFFQLIAELKAGFNNKTSEMELLGPLIAVDLLIIDELGKGRNSDFETIVLDQLIMGRYNQDRTIVASTNCDFVRSRSTHTFQKQLDSYEEKSSRFAANDFGSIDARVGSRIFSRLVEMTDFLQMTGENMRMISHD